MPFKSVSLLLVVVVASASAAPSAWSIKCHESCTHSEHGQVLGHLDKACEAYRYTLPRPTVYRKCKRAFNTAMQTSCTLACDEEHHDIDTQHAMLEDCKHEKNETPRPTSFEACKQGYEGGVAMAVGFATSLRNEHEAAAAAAAAEQGEDEGGDQQSGGGLRHGGQEL
jgi:hypothetical protein